MDEAKKLKKEQFISQYNYGTSSFEVCLILAICPLSYFFYSQLYRAFPRLARGKIAGFCLEFIALVVPNVLSCCAPRYNVHLALLLASTGFLCYALRARDRTRTHKPTTTASYVDSLSIYRFYVQSLTCISILAVDFVVFPRRLAKTESYGISLMDMGVGIVVLSSGLVSGVSNKLPLSKWKLQHSLAPLVLGIMRFGIVKLLNYQTHATEYGSHWNFFLTIGLMPLVVSILTHFKSLVFGNRMRIQLFCVLIAVVYQWALDHTLSAYVLNAPRVNFFSHNREGIISLLGYSVIYIIASDIGKKLRNQTGRTRTTLLLLHGVLYALLYSASVLFSDISRRLLNLPYIAFVLCTSLVCIAALEVFLAAIPSTPRSILVDLVSGHQLQFFLLANLLTGLVNFLVDTIEFSNLEGFSFITLYMFVLYLITLVLFSKHFYNRSLFLKSKQ